MAVRRRLRGEGERRGHRARLLRLHRRRCGDDRVSRPSPWTRRATRSWRDSPVSTETDLPGEASGPICIYNGGVNDAFVAKVNAAGTDLVYCGYIGGAAND